MDLFNSSLNITPKGPKLDPAAPYYDELVNKWQIYPEDVQRLFAKNLNRNGHFRFFIDKAFCDVKTIFSCDNISWLFLYVYYIAVAPYQCNHFITFMENYRQYLSHDEWYYLFVVLLLRDDVKDDTYLKICSYPESNPLFYMPESFGGETVAFESDTRNSIFAASLMLNYPLAYLLLTWSPLSRKLLNLFDNKGILPLDAEYLLHKYTKLPFFDDFTVDAMSLRGKIIKTLYGIEKPSSDLNQTLAVYIKCQVESFIKSVWRSRDYFSDIYDLLQLVLNKDKELQEYFVSSCGEPMLADLLTKVVCKEQFELAHLLVERFNCPVKMDSLPFKIIVNHIDEVGFLRKAYMLQAIE